MNCQIKIINQLTDNYSYITYNEKSDEAIIVDPSEEKPLLEFLRKNRLKLIAILITHHHADHTSGIIEIKKNYDVEVFTPNKKINGTTKHIRDNDKIMLNFIDFEVISTPGHTLDHVVYFSKKEKLLFSGDTLFFYGCGRVFEGTNEQMLNSLNKIKKLPDDTIVYCGHEYTYKNLEFVLDELVYLQDKGAEKSKFKKLINERGSSMPFHLGHQKNMNPFLNCNDIRYKQKISDFHKNEGKIRADASELDFFNFIREKRNNY